MTTWRFKKKVVGAEGYHPIRLWDQGTHSPSNVERLAKVKPPLQQRQPSLCLIPFLHSVQDSSIGSLQLQSWGSDLGFDFSLAPPCLTHTLTGITLESNKSPAYKSLSQDGFFKEANLSLDASRL